MSTFTQWRAAIDRGDLRRVTWVCGEQRILVEEVVYTTRVLANVDELGYLSLRLGEIDQHGMWDILNQYTSGARRFIVIRNAEQVTNWGPLASWLGDRSLAGIHVVFVSNEHDITHTVVDKKREVAPHLATMMSQRRHAVVVRCATPNPTDAVAWVSRRAGIPQRAAQHLLIRVGGDLTAAASVADKLAVFDTDAHIGPEIVDLLCDQIAADTFAECLLMLRKRDALSVVQSLDERDYGKVLGLLDSRLDLLAKLCHYVRAGASPREMNGLPHFLVRAYLHIAKHYDPPRCAHGRRVLAVIDDALRGGARDGLMEALVALW